MGLGISTSLWRTKVFSRSWSPRSAAPGLLDAQGSTLKRLALKALLGSIRLLQRRHLDETKAARLLGVRVKHDLALLNFAIFGKESHYIILSQTGVDSGNEKVGSRVSSTISIAIAAAVTTTVRCVRQIISRAAVVRTLDRRRAASCD